MNILISVSILLEYVIKENLLKTNKYEVPCDIQTCQLKLSYKIMLH